MEDYNVTVGFIHVIFKRLVLLYSFIVIQMITTIIMVVYYISKYSIEIGITRL